MTHIGALVRATDLPGEWSVWAEAPSTRHSRPRWWLIPHDQQARNHVAATPGGDPYRDVDDTDLTALGARP